jgi:hypothetical protein
LASEHTDCRTDNPEFGNCSRQDAKKKQADARGIRVAQPGESSNGNHALKPLGELGALV